MPQLIGATHLLTSSSDSAATSFTTATLTVTQGLFVYAFVHNVKVGTGDIPTLSGCGMTWYEAATTLGGGGSIERLSLFVAQASNPTVGTITIDFAGNSQAKCYWSFSELRMVDLSEGPLAAVVQTAGNFDASSTTSTATLSSFSNSLNATIGGGRADGLGTGAAGGTGFTILGSNQNSSFILSEFASDNRTAVSWSQTAGNTDMLTLGAEIRAAKHPFINRLRPYPFSPGIAR